MLELDAYWCLEWRCWVLRVIDENGDQIGESDYYSNRTILAYALANF